MRALIGNLFSANSSTSTVLQTLISRIVLIGISLATGVITARSFGPAGRGEQSAMGLWPWFIVGLVTLGQTSALRYHTSRDAERAPSMLLAASTIVMASGILGACIAAALLPTLLTSRYSAVAIHNAQIIVFFAPVLLLFGVVRAFLEATGRFKSSNMNSLVSPIVTIFALLLLRAIHALTPFTANLALFGPVSVQTAWLVFGLRATFFASDGRIYRQFRTLLSYGLRSYGSDIMGTLSAQADQAVIIAFLTPSALGLYTVALMASRMTNVIQDSLNSVLFPKASGLEPAAALAMVRRVARISTVITAAIIAFLMIVVPILLPLFYGARFQSAAHLTQILMLEAFFGGTASVLMQAFLATGRPAIMTAVQAGWLAASLVLLTILVPRMGINGAAIALALSSLLRLAIVMAAYPLILKTAIPRLIPTRPDLAYARSRARGLIGSG